MQQIQVFSIVTIDFGSESTIKDVSLIAGLRQTIYSHSFWIILCLPCEQLVCIHVQNNVHTYSIYCIFILFIFFCSESNVAIIFYDWQVHEGKDAYSNIKQFACRAVQYEILTQSAVATVVPCKSKETTATKITVKSIYTFIKSLLSFCISSIGILVATLFYINVIPSFVKPNS